MRKIFNVLGEPTVFPNQHARGLLCPSRGYPETPGRVKHACRKLTEIYRLTHGLARQINRLAWHCLMAAALETKDLVDQSCLDQAVTEVLPPELS